MLYNHSLFPYSEPTRNKLKDAISTWANDKIRAEKVKEEGANDDEGVRFYRGGDMYGIPLTYYENIKNEIETVLIHNWSHTPFKTVRVLLALVKDGRFGIRCSTAPAQVINTPRFAVDEVFEVKGDMYARFANLFARLVGDLCGRLIIDYEPFGMIWADGLLQRTNSEEEGYFQMLDDDIIVFRNRFPALISTVRDPNSRENMDETCEIVRELPLYFTRYLPCDYGKKGGPDPSPSIYFNQLGEADLDFRRLNLN